LSSSSNYIFAQSSSFFVFLICLHFNSHFLLLISFSSLILHFSKIFERLFEILKYFRISSSFLTYSRFFFLLPVYGIVLTFTFLITCIIIPCGLVLYNCSSFLDNVFNLLVKYIKSIFIKNVGSDNMFKLSSVFPNYISSSPYATQNSFLTFFSFSPILSLVCFFFIILPYFSFIFLSGLV
jgi:hypothetical protein